MQVSRASLGGLVGAVRGRALLGPALSLVLLLSLLLSSPMAPATTGNGYLVATTAAASATTTTTTSATTSTTATTFSSNVGSVPGTPTHFQFPLQPVSLSGGTNHPASTGVTLLPGPFRSTYGVDALLNSSGGSPPFARNMTIGVLAWGDGYNPSDLQTFFSTYYPSSFPRPHVIAVPIDGAPPPGVNAGSDPSGGSRELTIDIEWAASMAPGATIYAIYAPPGTSPPWSPTGTSLEDALGYAVGLGNLTVLSLSFGEAQGSDPSLESAMDQQFLSLAKNGTTVVAASGDDGGSAATQPGSTCTQGPGVNFPAASPYVLSVGGTDASGPGPEVAWSLSGGGAAASTANDPAPAWQELGGVASYVARTTGHTRQVPDVSATARDNGYFFDGTLSVADGTSFSTPLWAGILADIAATNGARLGEVDASLYSLAAIHEAGSGGASPFTDVTSGGNCYDRANPGWDQVTGWGTPNAVALDQGLRSWSFTTLTVDLSPSSSVSAGATVSVAAGPTASSSPPLAGARLNLSVLDPINDSWVSRIVSALPSASAGGWWHGNLTMPASLTGSWVNVTVVAQNGSAWGIGTAVISPPPPPAPPAPSIFDILLGNPLPVLAGFFLLFLVFRFYSDRRRTVIRGPSPGELSGQPASPAGEGDAAPPPKPERRGTSVGPELTPFCWKCGANLSGKEKQCPSCGTPFSS